MYKPMSFDEWYDKFEEELSNDCYIAYMESGAYLDSDREKFEEDFLEDKYNIYLKNHEEYVEDYCHF